MKPRAVAAGVNGSAAPIAASVKVLMISALRGWLRKNGMRRVRITKMIRLCVASDSTNQVRAGTWGCQAVWLE